MACILYVSNRVPVLGLISLSLPISIFFSFACSHLPLCALRTAANQQYDLSPSRRCHLNPPSPRIQPQLLSPWKNCCREKKAWSSWRTQTGGQPIDEHKYQFHWEYSIVFSQRYRNIIAENTQYYHHTSTRCSHNTAVFLQRIFSILTLVLQYLSRCYRVFSHYRGIFPGNNVSIVFQVLLLPIYDIWLNSSDPEVALCFSR